MKLYKKRLIVLLLVFAVVSLTSLVYGDSMGNSGNSSSGSGDNNVSVVVNGTKIVYDTKPEVVKNRTMVPLRKTFESLGITVTWDATTQTIVCADAKTGKTITLQVGSTNAVVASSDGTSKNVTLDVAPYIKGDRTMIPLRVISEELGAKVSWDGTTNTVKVDREDSNNPSMGPESSMGPNASQGPEASQGPRREDHMIIISNLAFSIPSLTVNAGAVVTWKNKDTVSHRIVSDDGVTFDSGILAPNQNFSFKFITAGTFSYHSSDTPTMIGTIIVLTVTPEPSQTPWPSMSPEPSHSPWPSMGPEPTQSPWPSMSPEPTQTPEPSQTPQPSQY